MRSPRFAPGPEAGRRLLAVTEPVPPGTRAREESDRSARPGVQGVPGPCVGQRTVYIRDVTGTVQAYCRGHTCGKCWRESP